MFYWIECTIKYTKSYFISHFVWNIAHAILLKSHIQLENNLCAFCWYPARESKICWRLFSETYLTLAVEDNLWWDKSIVIRGLVKTFQSETVFFRLLWFFRSSSFLCQFSFLRLSLVLPDDTPPTYFGRSVTYWCSRAQCGGGGRGMLDNFITTTGLRRNVYFMVI